MFLDNQSLKHNGCVYGTYLTTVFLLDTSASMAGAGLEQMKKAFKEIVHGKRLQLNIAEESKNIKSHFKLEFN